MKPCFCHQPKRGFTLIELLVVLAVIAILAMMVYPGGPKDKARALRIQCINNLKQNGLAFRVWAGDHGDKYPMEISETNGGAMEFLTGSNLFRQYQVVSNELSTPKVVICPADSSRMAATNFGFFNNSNVSFFINLNATNMDPQAILSGDRNLTNNTSIRNGILTLTTNRPAGWTAEIHNKVGNLLLADGSVQQVSSTGLRTAIVNTSAFTNRLLMPILGP
jgi:prepilin-type N-terminal cleavage/methylation domain-containing protein/prepilin-type processing-associated H-X9-DG protein